MVTLYYAISPSTRVVNTLVGLEPDSQTAGSYKHEGAHPATQHVVPCSQDVDKTQVVVSMGVGYPDEAQLSHLPLPPRRTP